MVESNVSQAAFVTPKTATESSRHDPISKSGGDASTIYALPPDAIDGGAWISAIAADGTSVYVGVASTGSIQTLGSPNAGSLLQVSTDGGAATSLASNIGTPINLAFDAANIYWTDVSGAVDGVSLDGGAAHYLASPGGGQRNGLAVTDGYAYWSTALQPGTSPSPTATDGMIQCVAVSGGTPQTIATGFDFVGPAVDDTNVYWLDVFAQEVESAPLDGGTTRVLASSEPAAAGPVVVDDVALVWGGSDGRVRL